MVISFNPSRPAHCHFTRCTVPEAASKGAAVAGPVVVGLTSIVVVEREPHFEIDLVMRHLAIFDMTARL